LGAVQITYIHVFPAQNMEIFGAALQLG
jgi:hypothetical protein